MIEEVALVITIAGTLVAVLPKIIYGYSKRKESQKQRSEESSRAELKRDKGGRAEGLEDLFRGPVHETRIERGGVDYVKARYGMPRPSDSSKWVLVGFASLSGLFAIAAVWRYWDRVVALGDAFFLAGGLLVMMVAGMFVQVISANFTHDRPLLSVSASELIYPLLYAPIVFYPIWLVGDKEGPQVFAFYAAFINGYFWRSIVAAARRPEGG